MTPYDAVVVGAGPGGSIAALLAARAGKRVLLVERSAFPRDKVCGSCLNPRGAAILERLGLGGALAEAGAAPLTSVGVRSGSRSVRYERPWGVAVARDRLDSALAGAAHQAGAEFRDSTTATLLPHDGDLRRVSICTAGGDDVVEARLVIAADGLGGRTGLADGAESRVARGSRIGAGALLAECPECVRPGELTLVVGRGGYVGLVRLGDGRLDLAAAFAPAAVRAAGGLAPLAASILDSAGLGIPDLAAAKWRGTPALTRRTTAVAGHRLIALGDAAGYVEPFTGEGMTWAIQAAEWSSAVSGADLSAWDSAVERAWGRRLAAQSRARTICRTLALATRSCRATRIMIGGLSRAPRLARPVLSRLARPPAPPPAAVLKVYPA